MNCPVCETNLEAGKLGEAEVSMCPECMGTLVVQRELVRLLTELSKDLATQIDFDHKIEPLADSGASCACPTCSKPMARFGYMETNLAYAARCASCWQIWAAPDELGVMAVIYARTNFRREERAAAHDAQMEGLDRRVNLMLRSRFQTHRVGGITSLM